MLLRGQSQSSQRGILRTRTLTCRATFASGSGPSDPNPEPVQEKGCSGTALLLLSL